VTLRRGPHARDETGSALVELSWLAIILIVPLIWIVISVFQVQQGAFATSAAARAAGRAYALAPDDATGEARAQAVVRQVLADQGTRGQRARVEVTCDAPAGNCHVGTSVITVRVDSGVDLPFFPVILGGGTASFSLDASHTVPIGQYVESAPEDDER
jgi:Flp pilus assembly protein TadG